MASEVFSARESRVNAINVTGGQMNRTRQRNAVMNARIEPSEGRTRINLGGGQSAVINVHYVNRSQGTITGTLNLNGGSGSNRFQFGGRSGKSFEEALNEVKRDIRRNL